MLDVAERLKQQNNGHAWLDCNAHGVPHRWHHEQSIQPFDWWKCSRCPVRTRTKVVDGLSTSPRRFLRP